MKPQVLFVVAALAILAVLAALLLGHGMGERAEAATTASAWPCCDTCSKLCTRSIPPKCRCLDSSPHGCHSGCSNCVKSSEGGSDVFRCADMINCQRRCTPTPVA